MVVLNWNKRCKDFLWSKTIPILKDNGSVGIQIFFLYCYLIRELHMSSDEAISNIRKKYGDQISEKYLEYENDLYNNLASGSKEKYFRLYDNLCSPVFIYQSEIDSLRNADISIWVRRQLLVDLCIRKALGSKNLNRKNYFGGRIESTIRHIAKIPRNQKSNFITLQQNKLNYNNEKYNDGSYEIGLDIWDYDVDDDLVEDIVKENNKDFIVTNKDNDDNLLDCEDEDDNFDSASTFFQETRNAGLVRTIDGGDEYLFEDKEGKSKIVSEIVVLNDVIKLFPLLQNVGKCRWCHRKFTIPLQAKQVELCPRCYKNYLKRLKHKCYKIKMKQNKTAKSSVIS